MEGVKNEMRHLVFMNFHQINLNKGKPYTVKFFAQLNVGSKQVYRAIAQVESGQSHLQQKSNDMPQKLSKPQEKSIVKTMEIKNFPESLIRYECIYFNRICC